MIAPRCTSADGIASAGDDLARIGANRSLDQYRSLDLERYGEVFILKRGISG